MARGLAVRGSYDQNVRNIEAHFYFPYDNVVDKRKIVDTAKIGSGRVASSITTEVKDLLGPNYSKKDWFKWADKITDSKGNEVPYVILYPRSERIKVPIKYKDFKNGTIRFEYPAPVRRKYNIEPYERHEIEIPIPGSPEVIDDAKQVLRKWLNDNDYMIPPFKDEPDEFKRKARIGVQNLEDKDLKDNQFSLRVYDYDSGRIAKRSDFAFDKDWYKDPQKVKRVMDIANRNTRDWSGFKAETNKTRTESKYTPTQTKVTDFFTADDR